MLQKYSPVYAVVLSVAAGAFLLLQLIPSVQRILRGILLLDAKMADANLFIQKMPEGYDTIVGERGVGLSGGQKQRISLARALLKDPSILILDDTTSAVDMETESYIQNQLKKIEKDCTIFIIAYRISSIKDADLILVMDQGRIVEQGTHEELVRAGGYYATAFHHQYGDYEQQLSQSAGKEA